MREKASSGAEPVSEVTRVCTEEAHTPPALVTSVAKRANAPTTKPAPIQPLSLTLPGLVRM